MCGNASIRTWAASRGRTAIKALAIGGTSNHVHLLLSLPATVTVAKAAQVVKAGSSKWIHEEFPKLGLFEWQEGYGAFSVGISQADDTIAYIRRQEEHHRRISPAEEWRAILARHEDLRPRG